MKKRALTLMLALSILPGAVALPAAATDGAKSDVGLTIIAPSSVTVLLHKGMAKRSTSVVTTDTVSPTSMTTADGQTTYFFKDLAAGAYHYTLQRSGYYTVFRNINYTGDYGQTGRTVVAAEMEKRSGTYFEPTAIQLPSEELAELYPSSPTQWGEEYAQLFTTPYFLRDKSVSGMHQQTTHQEMLDFINGLAATNDHMYVFSLGTSPKYGFEMPLVVFTKENIEGKTLEEVAEIFKANSKPTFHFQGQIHSDEPAGGETALAFIKQMAGDWGDHIMDTMDVYFIPRVNPDGARSYIRGNVANALDMNRDFMSAISKEVQTVIRVYNMFRPEVTACTHEMYLARPSSRVTRMEDVDASMSSPARSLPETADLEVQILEQMRANAEAKGLRVATYSSYAYSANMLVDNGYLGSRGSIGVLTETTGKLVGSGIYERRVFSAYIVIKTLFDYVAEHPDEVVDLVRRNRQNLIDRGATYEEDDLFVVSQLASPAGPVWPAPQIDQVTGEIVDPDATYTNYIPTEADIQIVRPRATAYLIPMDLPAIDEVIRILNVHDIKWYTLPAGTAVNVRQYLMPSKPATLTEEKEVVFPAGACVCPMDQDVANVLGMFMEPDSVGHQSSDVPGNVFDLGLVTTAADGSLPVYRYCRDLSDSKLPVSDAPVLTAVQPTEEYGTGAITGLDPARSYEICASWDTEYSPVPAASTEIGGLCVGTYFVRYAAEPGQEASAPCSLAIVDNYATTFAIYVGDGGNDANDGRLAERPVKTLDTAYNKLAALMRSAPAGTEGTIVLVGTVTLPGETRLPAHDFPVVITGETPSSGITSAYDLTVGGDTRMEKMTVTLTTSAMRHIYAAGHRLEIGEGVSGVPSGGYYFNLSGGAPTALEGDAELIVRSGTWRHIYAAGYKQPVSGDVHLTVTGGNVTYQIQTSYTGEVGGSVTMELSGAADAGNVYCANASSGDVAGDITVTLGKGFTAQNVYGGSRTAGSAKGNVHLILDGASVAGLDGGCANTQGTVKSSRITLKDGVCSGAIAGDRIDLDTSAGGQVTLSDDLTADSVTGGGSLRLPAGKKLTISGAVTGSTALLFSGSPESGALCVTARSDAAEDAFVSGAADLRLTGAADASARYWYVASGKPGDLNGDGSINAKDVVLLMRGITGGYGVELSDSGADLNRDDSVNVKDAVTLMRYLAGGYGVTLG